MFLETPLRNLSPEPLASEVQMEQQIRPQSFDEFPGQGAVKKRLQIFTQAAKSRGDALDHVLLSGPPGLGKTTLARILALHLGVEFRSTSAPAIEKKGDLAALLTGLSPRAVLFIDEIHRLSRTLEEYLYTAMEDYSIDLMMGEGLSARSMKFQLVPFTLIGATTRSGMLNSPFRDRFGIQERLEFYSHADLAKILHRSAGLLGVQAQEGSLAEMARRSRGTPRIANRLLKRVRDFAQVQGVPSPASASTAELIKPESEKSVLTPELTRQALDELGVDNRGLDSMDRLILRTLQDKFSGGPVGIETLAAMLNEETETLEEVYEPFLLQEGYLQKTPRGRVLSALATEALGADSASAFR